MNKHSDASDILTTIKYILGALLWCYCIYRAVNIEITHDEAYSYLLVKTNYWKALVGTANTHWLNSIFMKLFLWVPGVDLPWKLRMLSVLSWPVYAYSTIKVSTYLRSRSLSGLFFLLAMLNPFLLFYFSQARGYAAACAFSMLTLLYVIKAVRQQDVRSNTWFYIFVVASLAVIANFSAFYFFVGLVGAYFFYLFCKNQLQQLLLPAARKLIILIIAVSVFTISELLFIKYYTGDLEFGGDADLIQSIFGSLVSKAVYSNVSAGLFYGCSLLLFYCYILALAVAFYRVVLSKLMSVAAFFLSIGAVILLMNGLFHLFFKTPYLTERTALIFYPVLLAGLFYFLDVFLLRASFIKVPVFIFSALGSVFLCFNFFESYSPSYFKEFPVQANTKECLDYLARHKATKVGLHYWHYAVYSNYYKHAYPGHYQFDYEIINTKKLTQIREANVPGDLQYLVLAPPDTAATQTAENWLIKLQYPQSGNKVLINNKIRKSNP